MRRRNIEPVRPAKHFKRSEWVKIDMVALRKKVEKLRTEAGNGNPTLHAKAIREGIDQAMSLIEKTKKPLT